MKRGRVYKNISNIESINIEFVTYINPEAHANTLQGAKSLSDSQSVPQRIV